MVYEPSHHLLALLEGFQRRLGQEVRERMRGSGLLRGSEGRILGLIEPEGTRPTTLAEGSWITKQAIGKRVRELEDRGLVAVRPDPDDRRAVRVYRTKRGEEVKTDTELRIAELEATFADEVGADRYHTFCEVLAELARG